MAWAACCRASRVACRRKTILPSGEWRWWVFFNMKEQEVRSRFFFLVPLTLTEAPALLFTHHPTTFFAPTPLSKTLFTPSLNPLTHSPTTGTNKIFFSRLSFGFTQT
ncbi:hypothetical protein E2C01_088081 [Portunus trituberculatus]|uniref:Uncharacterized protein n=1 Tax=Portunus trituberculatus TaxID=210409 RepID=A0A5B7JFQ8_PORTR|nr:hypothetical protein [Portunus trituberculatus]